VYIGYMGDIVFSVSVWQMITPTNYERESTARWAEHDLLLRKPVSQFGGPGLEKLSFSIILDADHGVSPALQLKKLRKMRDTGAVFPLVIGGRPVTQNSWRLDSVKEGNCYWTPDGQLQQCIAQLSLTEYEEGNHTEENAVTVSYGSNNNAESNVMGGN
jgi:phage protein U